MGWPVQSHLEGNPMKALYVASIIAVVGLFFVLLKWTPRIPREPWATLIPVAMVVLAAAAMIAKVVVS